MRLKSHLPSLSPNLHLLLPLLTTARITQAQTLLFTPASEILALLPPPAAPPPDPAEHVWTIGDIEQLQREVAKLESPSFDRGDHLIESERGREAKRRGMWAGVGEKGLDRLLEGMGSGQGGGVMEISGGELEGGGVKALVCLHLVLEHLIKNPETAALWVDTEGDFSGERALAVLREKGVQGEETTAVLDRLVIQRMFDLAPFSELVSKLHLDLEPTKEAEDEPMEGKHRSRGFSMLVVESITSLYDGFIASEELEGRASLISHLHYLSTLSKSYPLLSILTNHSIPSSRANISPYPYPSRLPRSNTRPALDLLFAHLTDLTLWLETPAGYTSAGDGRGKAGWEVVAQVLRSRVGPSGGFSAFHTNGTSLTSLN